MNEKENVMAEHYNDKIDREAKAARDAYRAEQDRKAAEAAAAKKK